MPCWLSTRQIGSTPNSTLWSSMESISTCWGGRTPRRKPRRSSRPHWPAEAQRPLSNYSNRIVNYSIQSRMKARIVVDAIEYAAARRQMEGADVVGCILHSDRGSQTRAHGALRALRRHDLVGSMGKVGSAGDNAAMESISSILQRKALDTRRTWQTRQDLRLAS